MNLINVYTRTEFDIALSRIDKASIIVCDTETNTLNVRSAVKMPLVSIQVYLPEFKVGYNFSFRHGYGDMFLKDGRLITDSSLDTFADETPVNKKLLRWYYIYNLRMQIADASGYIGYDMGNLPISYLDELKAVWTPDKQYIYHNAKFDLSVLHREGFPDTPNVIDTMNMLQIVWGDWGGKRNNDDKGIRVRMPNRYFDKTKADYEGKEWGNRQLKWQARFWDIDNAEGGELSLRKNMEELQRRVAKSYVDLAEMGSAHTLFFDCYSSWAKDPYSRDRNGVTWHDRQVERVYEQVKWSDSDAKGFMWMLPSDYVATYGMMDVVLTWELYSKALKVIEGWGSEAIFDEINRIDMFAWRMEQNGILLDIDEAQRRIDINYNRANAIMGKYDWNIDSWQAFKDHVGDALNLPDTRADTVKKALDWIESDKTYGGITGAYAIQVIEDRLKYKRIIKQTSTYLKRWVDSVDPNGYCHARIDVAGTKTGRTTSSGDLGNVQNIPARGANIKEVLITPDDHLVFGIDYSNLELRVAAWIAENILGLGNREMTDVINSRDAHAYTAEVLGVRNIMYGDMTDREIAEYNNMAGWRNLDDATLAKLVYKFYVRQVGKTANFNLIYGGSHWSLGLQLGESFETDAEDGSPDHWDILSERFAPYETLHAKWHTMYPAFIAAAKHFETEALQLRPTPAGVGKFQYNMNYMPYYRSAGRAITDYMYGRPIKHHLYDTSRNVRDPRTGKWGKVDIKKYSAEKAWNNIVQGSASHVNMHSGWRYYNMYPNTHVKLFAGIHDALDGYAHVDYLQEVRDLMHVMEDWGIEPRLDVELEAGLDNWQHMKEVVQLDIWVQSKGREGYE